MLMANVKQITDDIEKALRSGNAETLQTLRMLASQLHNREIEKKAKEGEAILTDDEVLESITREIKKRREAAELFVRGGRKDLAEKEQKEAVILSQYLPEQMTDNEVEVIVAQVIADTGATTEKDFGKVMGIVTKQTKGKADSKRISELVKSKLAS